MPVGPAPSHVTALAPLGYGMRAAGLGPAAALSAAADNMRNEAQKFKKSAGDLKKQQWWKNMKARPVGVLRRRNPSAATAWRGIAKLIEAIAASCTVRIVLHAAGASMLRCTPCACCCAYSLSWAIRHAVDATLVQIVQGFTLAVRDTARSVKTTCMRLQMMAILGCVVVTVIAIIIVVIVKNTGG